MQNQRRTSCTLFFHPLSYYCFETKLTNTAIATIQLLLENPLHLLLKVGMETFRMLTWNLYAFWESEFNCLNFMATL